MQESSLPDIFTANSWVSPNATTRSRSNAKSPSDGVLSSATETKEENHPIFSLAMSSAKGAIPKIAQPNIVKPDTFDLRTLGEEMQRSIQSDVAMDEKPMQESHDKSSSSSADPASCSSFVVLEPDEICIPSIDASLVPSFNASQRIELLHNGFPFQLQCTGLKIRFGISTKFLDNAGRPRLSFVVDASPSLCKVLDACDSVAQKLCLDSGSSSDWRPAVIRKDGFFNYPTARLQ